MSIWSSRRGIAGDFCDDPRRPGKLRNSWDPCDGCWECETGTPWVYEHSAVMPDEDGQRGGSIDLAALSSFVRHARDHQGDQGDDFVSVEPWLRFGVHPHGADPATLIINVAQARDLARQLTQWADAADPATP